MMTTLMMTPTSLCMIVMCAFIEQVSTKVYEEPLPKEFADCLRTLLPKSQVQRDPAYNIDYACANKFLTSTPHKRWAPQESSAEKAIEIHVTDVVKQLKVQRQTEHVRYDKRSIRRYLRHRRQKRADVNPTILRKEYRRMTTEERTKFHTALQLLKEDKTFSTNESNLNLYDTLCNLHHNSRAPHAHFGPAFLSWHRVALYIFENALRSKVPGVFIPYWDSRLEGALSIPSATSLFTDELIGPGNGVVMTGHFANWSHPFAGDLIRNVGNLGEPIQRRDIERIINVRRTEEFVFPTASFSKNIEIIHSKVHLWVSGTMNNLNFSPADPIFWLHHCFIDYIWERIRQNQRKRGINPLFDYPENGGKGHLPGDTLSPFAFKNRDAFMIDWSKVYTYEESPADINCGSDGECGSNYYLCDGGLCRAKTVDEMRYSEGTRNRRSVSEIRNLSSNVKANGSHPLSLIVDYPTHSENPIVSKNLQTSPLFHSMQNTFMINGKEDSKAWVDIPVIIYSKRPGDLVFDAHPFRNGDADLTTDVFQSTRSEEAVLPRSGNPATTKQCQHVGSGASKVYLRSIGLNYEGDYTSEAVIDERQLLTMTLTQVAVQKPYKNDTKSYIAAYDQCGRMCTPFCLTGKNGTYHKCTGSVRIDARIPRMYNTDSAGTILQAFDFSTFPPKLVQNKVFLVFYCGKEDKWPWLLGDGGEHGFDVREGTN